MSRTNYEYSIDPNLNIIQGECQVDSLSMVELTIEQQLDATKRAKGGGGEQIVIEHVKASLAAVNGKPVTLADGSADSVFGKMSAQVRDLIVCAYQEIHTAPEAARASFMLSKKITVR